MTDKFDERDQMAALQEFRDELGGEFIRVARAQSEPRTGQRLRRGALAILAAAIVAPGAIAAESELNGATTPETEPAAAPVLSPGSECPKEVQDLLREVQAREMTLSEYQQSPGYPVDGCPTVEELRPRIQEPSPN
jgi:hypothetical protein